MTRTLLVSAACVALLSACNQNGASPAVDKAQDMAAAPVGQISAATMGSNMVSAFVPNAAMSNMYEIQAADIALERATGAEIKSLARTIKADHTAALDTLKGLAPTAAPDVALPNALDERRQGLIDNLRSASASDFDRVYLDQQIAAHEEAVTLMSGFRDNTDAPALAAYAGDVLPKIQSHLDMAKRIKTTM
jgi:putative membrane protein